MKKILIVLTIIIFASCSDYLDVNDNPNSFLPEDIIPEQMLTGVLLANQFWQTASGPRVAMIWLNQGTGSDRQYEAFNDWNLVTSSSFDNSWSNAYAGCLFDANEMYKKSLEIDNVNLAAVAQIIKAHTLGTLTSLWGDVPYSEAFNDDLFPNPKFDSQLEVYGEIQNMLQEAIEFLESGSIIAIPGNADFVYGGDKASWIKLAHSLKARYFLHVKDYPKAKVEAQLGISASLDNDGVFFKAADYKAVFHNLNGAKNPYWTFDDGRADYLTSDNCYGYDLLDASSDVYRGNTKSKENKRSSYYYTTDNTNLQVLNFGGTGRFGAANNIPLVTHGEMRLIIAECEARESFSAGVTAYNNYRELLKHGYGLGPDDNCFGGDPQLCDLIYFKYYEESDFQAGGIENEDGIDPTQALLREIYEERYVYFTGTFEGLVDFGRTDNIAEIQLKDGNTGTPQRFIYPQTEINANTSTPSPIPPVTEKTPVNQ